MTTSTRDHISVIHGHPFYQYQGSVVIIRGEDEGSTNKWVDARPMETEADLCAGSVREGSICTRPLISVFDDHLDDYCFYCDQEPKDRKNGWDYWASLRVQQQIVLREFKVEWDPTIKF